MSHSWKIPPPEMELPSKSEFTEARHKAFGQTNPELMDVPFWQYMVRSMTDPYWLREHFEVDPIGPPPSDLDLASLTWKAVPGHP